MNLLKPRLNAGEALIFHHVIPAKGLQARKNQ
jgi:hypothetical protein